MMTRRADINIDSIDTQYQYQINTFVEVSFLDTMHTCQTSSQLASKFAITLVFSLHNFFFL